MSSDGDPKPRKMGEKRCKALFECYWRLQRWRCVRDGYEPEG